MTKIKVWIKAHKKVVALSFAGLVVLVVIVSLLAG